MGEADFVVGIIGNIFSILSYVAPCQFSKIMRSKSSENYNGFPYVMSLLSCCLWTLYGALDPDVGILIIIVNVIGIVSQIIYLSLLLTYYPVDKKFKYFGSVLLGLVLFGIVVAITLVAFHNGLRHRFIGVLCAMFSFIAYAAPLTTVRTTIKTKSVEYMPFLLILTFFIKGCVWFAFALIVKDFYVLVPNAAGIVLGTIQLSVYFIYKKSKSTPTEDVMVKVEEGIIVDNDNQLEFKTNVNISSQALPPKSHNENEFSKLKSRNLRNPSLSRQCSFQTRISPIRV